MGLSLRIFFFLKISKKFKYGHTFAAGRNFLGRICVQHQGGGSKVNFLKIDRYRYLNKFGSIFRILKHFFFFGLCGFNYL